MTEETGQGLQRLAVIFDHQNTQASSPLIGNFCSIAAHLNALPRNP